VVDVAGGREGMAWHDGGTITRTQNVHTHDRLPPSPIVPAPAMHRDGNCIPCGMHRTSPASIQVTPGKQPDQIR
jgi:hypothetical protein